MDYSSSKQSSTSDIETARKKYLEAEKASDITAKKKLFIQAAELYLKAAETLTGLDDQSRAGLVYLSCLSMRRSQFRDDIYCSDTNRIENDSVNGITSYEDRVVTYNSLRNRVAGLDKIPKASQSSNIASDLKMLESKLCDLGITRDDTFSNTSDSNNRDLFSLKSYSSILDESFLILNNSRVTQQDSKSSSDQSPVQGAIKSPVQNRSLWGLLFSSDNDSATTNSDKIISNQAVVNVYNRSPSTISSTRSIPSTIQSPISKTSMHDHGRMTSKDIQWNEQSSMLYKKNIPNSTTWVEGNTGPNNEENNKNNTFNIHNNGQEVSMLAQEIITLKQQLQVLNQEKVSMVKQIQETKQQYEQNKRFKQELTEFKKEYHGKFEYIKQSLSDFAAKYPHLDNPANGMLSPSKPQVSLSSSPASMISSLSTPTTPNTPYSSNNNLTPQGNESTLLNTSPNGDTDVNSNRIRQLELIVSGLLTKINQKDKQIKKFEEYFYRKNTAQSQKTTSPSIPQPSHSKSLNSNISEESSHNESKNQLGAISQPVSPAGDGPTSVYNSHNHLKNRVIQVESPVHRNRPIQQQRKRDNL